MASLREGWNIQVRVIKALMIRELLTRFGRENFGFLWMMVEPLLFASLVGVMWTYMRGPTERNGITTAAFVASGYVPLMMFRHVVSRAVGVFTANSSLMYHRQIKILDFILVRFLIEMIGGIMAFMFIGSVLMALGMMPLPAYPDYLLAGFALYSIFTLSLGLILAPLSEVSEVWEKIIPVSTYVMIPFAGTFTMNSWLKPQVARFLIYSPFVDPMEMIRYGIFGKLVTPIYDPMITIYVTLPCLALGLVMCRRVRRRMAIE